MDIMTILGLIIGIGAVFGGYVGKGATRSGCYCIPSLGLLCLAGPLGAV